MKTGLIVTALPLVLGAVLSANSNAAAAHARVEVAFVLDSTGSMGDLIDGAKRKIWSIATSIVDTNPQADIAMSIVTYRDKGDDYVVKSLPLTEDVQGLYGKLTQIEANGGGDTPESVNQALYEAINKLQWSNGQDVKRILFLVGDAPPHMNYQEIKYPEILKAAAQKHITVNAVQAGDMRETARVWKEIAQMGQGRFITIPQDGGHIVVIETPFDDEILHLQSDLDRTVVPYGDHETRIILESKMQNKAAAAPAVKLDNSSYYSKRGKTKEVVTGSGDLLGDVVNNRVVVGSIADKDLPEDLKKLSPEQRSGWVDEKLAARKTLETKMAELVAKRDAFVLEQKKKKPEGKDSFDARVEEALKEQLK